MVKNNQERQPEKEPQTPPSEMEVLGIIEQHRGSGSSQPTPETIEPKTKSAGSKSPENNQEPKGSEETTKPSRSMTEGEDSKDLDLMAQAAKDLDEKSDTPGLMPQKEEDEGVVEDMNLEGGDDHIKNAEGINITSGAEAAEAQKHFNNGLDRAA